MNIKIHAGPQLSKGACTLTGEWNTKHYLTINLLPFIPFDIQTPTEYL